MAHAIPFDTHEFIKEMKAAGFEERQAEALSLAMRKALDARLEETASKRDLVEMESRMDAKLLEAKLEIIKWVIGMSGVIVALIKLLPGGH
ncbi:MAG: DUF1640 domain-containing protein [Magnetococcales bacterium]|nr:DUF1640 domain-containing protein [Magnetococcales bacterium]